MVLFTLQCNSGIGDYIGRFIYCMNNLFPLLLPDYHLKMIKDFTYINYHCKELDFISLLYQGNIENSVFIENNKKIFFNF